MTTARLDNIAHAALRIRTGHGAGFGDAVNQVAVFANEFAALQRHYPILFLRGEDGALQPLAILGLERDENLFLKGAGWDAGYIPAILRRGPFLIGLAASGEPLIHIDLAHPRLANASDPGEMLFLPQGGHAPALEAALQALRTIHIGNEAAPVLDALFGELGLLEEVRLEVSLSETHTIKFDGYLAVTLERIAALDGAALERLSRAGLLDAAVFAAASLATMHDLAARKRRQG
jgi:hypothetical protein